ncbi:MAG: excinuclease ABC subunit UvrA [Bacteroidales bacterium]|nr:excinuclease ABC subunit UvrA [Bacteroidales bacterium]
MSEKKNYIHVYGAREHNLKNIDVSIPRNRLTVVTGLSGSGKSSLAFDTIYSEGQRRYVETMSAYARQFLGNLERPNVDRITGLSPVISIEQKTTNRNPRSTVGTVTEVYDFLRLLFARAADAYSYMTGEKMVKYTRDQILSLIMDQFEGKKVYFLAPVVKGRKGHYRELFDRISKKGYLHVRVDGEIREIHQGMKVDRYRVHDIEIVVDRLAVDERDVKRVRNSLATALSEGKGVCMLLEKDVPEPRYYSSKLMCPTTGISYNEPAPHSFSFNSPHGACTRCNGLGVIKDVDVDKIIPDKTRSIRQGGIAPVGKYRNALLFWQIEAIAKKYGFTLNDAIEDIPDEALNKILFGSEEPLRLENTPLGSSSNYTLSFDGIVNYVNHQMGDGSSGKTRKQSVRFVRNVTCPECGGNRLKKEMLHFRMGGKNISELAGMDIQELDRWINEVEDTLSSRQKEIAREIIKEISSRLHFLMDVGLGYLSLNRTSRSLSGGESQRIRLATQIGSRLVNVLYILDEPSIGLHQRDNLKLIDSLKKLRDQGNSVIVVEHDREMMKAADHILDLGPGAGRLGGYLVANGTPKQILRSDSLTAAYLGAKKNIEVPHRRRTGNGKKLLIRGASGNNLKGIDTIFPLGVFVCVTGVSGSGKSSLINDTLHPVLSNHLHNALKEPLPYVSLEGIEHIDKVIEVDQSPLGRTPRSNPATYTNVFGDIRKLFEQTPDAKIRGFSAGRFSFNVAGGRCESCGGAGVQTIEMNFLPDVYVQCKACRGKRYNRETLEVEYKGKNINDILQMTINQAAEFFQNIPNIKRKLKTMQDVGLGYIRLGQPSTTLSGGESQRVKLSAELSKKDTGRTLYILDEPTTGLHFEDVRVLLDVVARLVDKGNTVIMIEHNMDVIKVADHIIDMGPGGGADGGSIVARGTPEELALIKESHTGQCLFIELGKNQTVVIQED